MATLYVSHLGDGTAPTVGMAGAYPTQEAARAAAVAGDLILVAHDHVNPEFAVTTDVIYASTATNEIAIEVVDRLTLAKSVGTALNFSSAAGANITLRGPTNAGIMTIDGLNIRVGGGTASTGAGQLEIGTGFMHYAVKNLTVEVPNNSAGHLRSLAAFCEFDNLKIRCGNANGGLRGLNAEVIVRNSVPFDGSPVIPANLHFTNSAIRATWDHCDLSVFGAGKNYMGTQTSSTLVNIKLIACRIDSGCGIISGGVWANRFNELTMRNCIDETGRIHNEKHNASGSFTCSYSVSRSGGAQDVNGAPFSARLVSTAATNKHPVETFETNFEVPALKVGVSTTVTLHIVYDAAAANLNNLLTSDIWAEGMVHVAGRPNTLTGVNFVDRITVGAALPASAETWNGTGGFTTPTTRALTFTFTPDRTGLHKFRVKLAKPDVTAGVFICLSPDIT